MIGGVVRISWIKPYSGGVGITIQSYRIEVRNKQGSFVEHT